MNSRTRPSSAYPTTTASSSPESSPLSAPGVSVNVSNSNGSPTSSAALSTSAETTEDDSSTRSSISSPTIPITYGSLLTPSPLPGAPSSISISPPPSNLPHHLNTGAIIGVVLGALAALLAGALAVFLLFRRRARRSGRPKSTRMSVESSESRQRLQAHSYQDGTSRPASSVLTWSGSSVPGSADYEPKREPREHSPAPTETRPLAGDASVHSLHEGVLGVPAPFGHGDVPSASSELLALAGTGFAMGNSSNLSHGGLGRRGSGLSRTSASSGEVQSVEAL